MKTHFDTEEDQKFLRDILCRASMSTETFLYPHYAEEHLRQYRDIMFKLRAKIYEFLEEEDPNSEVIKRIQKTKPYKGESNV